MTCDAHSNDILDAAFMQSLPLSSRRELVRRADLDTARRAAPGVWINPVLMAVFAVATPYPARHPDIFALFAASILSLSAIRGTLLFGRKRLFGARPVLWRRLLHTTLLGAALVWGLFAAVTFRLFPVTDTAGVLVMGASLANCTAGVLVLMGRLRMLQLFVFLLLAPPALALAFAPPSPALALMVAVFLLFLTLEGRMLHREYWRGLEDNRLRALLEAAAREAEQARRAKSRFLSKVSHELLTPMNGVLGMANLLLDTDLKPQQREYLEMACHSAESMLYLIHNVIDFCAIEAGTLEARREKFAVREAVRGAMAWFAAAAKEKRLDLTWHVDNAVPEHLVGDSRWLTRLISCLMENAVKFTERGGVDLKVTVWGSAGGEIQLLLIVSDTGIGIPADRQEIIFEAFRQGDETAGRVHSGLGLGLRTAARLAELLHGRVWLESDVGRGTRFFVTASFETVQALEFPEKGRGGKNIFVAWRNPASPRLARRSML